MQVSKKRYTEAVKEAMVSAYAEGKKFQYKQQKSYLDEKTKCLSFIKEKRSKTIRMLTYLKDVAIIEKAIPTKLSLVDYTKVRCSEHLAEVKENTDKILAINKQLAELSECIRNNTQVEPGDDYLAVKRLLINGIIAEIKYEPGLISWRYPPMSYTYDRDKPALFLGKPVAGFTTRNEKGIYLALPSYGTNSRVGTLHMQNDEKGGSYCLGGFNNSIYGAACRYGIAEAILLFKSYFTSADNKSIYFNPDISLMDITNPKVEDDSFVLWGKENANKK